MSFFVLIHIIQYDQSRKKNYCFSRYFRNFDLFSSVVNIANRKGQSVGKSFVNYSVNIISTNSPNVAFARAIIVVKASVWYMKNTSN